MVKRNKGGQIWIETVLYTLIGLALIGITLSFVMPKVNASKDRAVIEQSIESLSVIQKKIDSLIEGGDGNVRKVDILLKKGELFIVPGEDKILIVLDEFGDPYTEPGQTVSIGRIDVLTEDVQKYYRETVSISYSGVVDIIYEGTEEEKKFNSAAVPQRFVMENLGDRNDDGIIEVDIREFY
jgi:type II secretory pathway pseudopilin PulG